jgi:hypothetical protein
MQNSVITIKIKQRLNKLDSQDYDNLECWHIIEAFKRLSNRYYQQRERERVKEIHEAAYEGVK